MRVVVQRVKRAAVSVAGRQVGAIGPGLLVFAGVESSDGAEDVEWLANKLVALRIFEDGDGRMNASVVDKGGAILLISQFTLFGNARKGTRPSFSRAAPPDHAREQLERLRQALETLLGTSVPTGEFGASMEIDVLNDGPVTLVLDTKAKDF